MMIIVAAIICGAFFRKILNLDLSAANGHRLTLMLNFDLT
jgi:hypothetical protein